VKSKYGTYSDIQLVEILRDKNGSSEGAFTELYHRYSSMVHAYCYRILNDEATAEDAFQETFIKFFYNVKPDLENTNVPGFLMKIARNICLNIKRDRKVFIDINEVDYLPDHDASYDKKELLELITLALDFLDHDHREAFILKEYDNLQYNEIAEICGISLNNAKSRVFRAKNKIKDILQPYIKDLCK
jgi:RNA polymerase sigma-70 factor (ECF subfamily)